MTEYNADSVTISLVSRGFLYRLWMAVLFVCTGELHIYRPHRVRVHGPVLISEQPGAAATEKA